VNGREQGGPRRAVRMIFSYEGDEIRLVSRQPVEVVIPPTDRVSEGEQGFWVETRSADGTTLHRRILPDPYRQDVEVFSDNPEQSVSRTPVERPRGSFAVLVPIDDADHVALFSSAAPRAPEAPAGAPAVEVARFSLREESQ
jgi:hypothetical protein